MEYLPPVFKVFEFTKKQSVAWMSLQKQEIQGRIIFLMREHANRHVTEEENDLNAEV